MPQAFTSTTSADAGFHGVIPPILLPMTDRGEPDTSSLERLVRHILDGGAHGLWVNGTTGEFYALDGSTRARVVRECVRAVDGRVPVIAHVGDTSTGLAVRHARDAVEAGADALSVLPPYLVGFGQEELKAHVRSIADAVGMPVLAYHLPQFAPVGLSIGSIVELAVDGVVCGAKDSSSDMVWFRQLGRRLRMAGAPIGCLTGGSSVADIGYLLGAAGTVSSIGNIAPHHLVRQYQAAREGDWALVRALQEQSEDLIALLVPPGIAPSPSLTMAVYKYLLAALGVIDSDAVAAPQQPLPAAAQHHLDERVLPMIHQLEHEVSTV